MYQTVEVLAASLYTFLADRRWIKGESGRKVSALVRAGVGARDTFEVPVRLAVQSWIRDQRDSRVELFRKLSDMGLGGTLKSHEVGLYAYAVAAAHGKVWRVRDVGRVRVVEIATTNAKCSRLSEHWVEVGRIDEHGL